MHLCEFKLQKRMSSIQWRAWPKEKAAGIKITSTDSLCTNNDNKRNCTDVNKLRMTLAKQLHLFKKILKRMQLKILSPSQE